MATVSSIPYSSMVTVFFCKLTIRNGPFNFFEAYSKMSALASQLANPIRSIMVTFPKRRIQLLERLVFHEMGGRNRAYALLVTSLGGHQFCYKELGRKLGAFQAPIVGMLPVSGRRSLSESAFNIYGPDSWQLSTKLDGERCCYYNAPACYKLKLVGALTRHSLVDDRPCSVSAV